MQGSLEKKYKDFWNTLKENKGLVGVENIIAPQGWGLPALNKHKGVGEHTGHGRTLPEKARMGTIPRH